MQSKGCAKEKFGPFCAISLWMWQRAGICMPALPDRMPEPRENLRHKLNI